MHRMSMKLEKKFCDSLNMYVRHIQFRTLFISITITYPGGMPLFVSRQRRLKCTYV